MAAHMVAAIYYKLLTIIELKYIPLPTPNNAKSPK